MASCEYIQVPCPNECKKDDKVQMITRKDLNQHLKEHCLNRDYECKHCKEKATYAYITGLHDSLCEKKVLSCPNTECDDTMERAKIKDHLENHCDYTIVSCKYESIIGCDVKLKRKDMGAHEQDDKVHLHQAYDIVVKLQDDIQSVTTTASAMKKASKEVATNQIKTIKLLKKATHAKEVELQSITKEIAAMKKEKDAVAVLLHSATESITSLKKEHDNVVIKLKEESEDMAVKFKRESDDRAEKLQLVANTIAARKKEIEEMTVDLRSNRMTITAMKNNDMAIEWDSAQVVLIGESITFKLTSYAQMERNNELYQSQSFYTGVNGYHIRIQVAPNGGHDKEDRHVSISMMILSGINDDSLKWPFIGTVKFELLNQLAYNTSNYHKMLSFDKEDSVYGISKFISRSKLTHDPVHNTQYLKDDTLYLRISFS